MQSCAGFGLAVDVDASLKEESGGKAGRMGRTFQQEPSSQPSSSWASIPGCSADCWGLRSSQPCPVLTQCV
jgi:hypothetical protein